MKQPRRTRQAGAPRGARAKTDAPRDAIAQRAYALYVARGRTDGHDLDDWLDAERELQRGSDH